MVKLPRSTLFNLDKINRVLVIEKQLLISDALIRRHIQSSGHGHGLVFIVAADEYADIYYKDIIISLEQ